jgi:hypothetical protein
MQTRPRSPLAGRMGRGDDWEISGFAKYPELAGAERSPYFHAFKRSHLRLITPFIVSTATLILFLLVQNQGAMIEIYGIRCVKGLFLLVKFLSSFSCGHAA